MACRPADDRADADTSPVSHRNDRHSSTTLARLCARLPTRTGVILLVRPVPRVSHVQPGAAELSVKSVIRAPSEAGAVQPVKDGGGKVVASRLLASVVKT